MAIKIAFVNNKGGTAKTTTVTNLAGAIHQINPLKKILIWDFDGQGNAARNFGINPSDKNQIDNQKTTYQIFRNNIEPENAIKKNIYEGIDLIPANNVLNFLEFDEMKDSKKTKSEKAEEIYSVIQTIRENNYDIEQITPDNVGSLVNEENASPSDDYFDKLHGKTEKIDEMYDFIFMDTPPELKSVTSSALSLADYVLIPYEPDSFSIDGIRNILDRISDIREDFNPNLKIGGLLATKFQSRANAQKDVILQINDFANRVGIPYFSTKIHQTIRFSEGNNKLPATLRINMTKKNNRNKHIFDYFDLVKEMEDKGIIKVSQK